jgi:hypothetical protein
MSSITSFPSPMDEESGAEYWERVRQLDRPFPWETDKSLPPGPVTISEEWATRDFQGEHWMSGDEEQARNVAVATGSTAVRRLRWVSVGPWQEAEG